MKCALSFAALLMLRSVLLIGRVKREPNVRVIIHDKSSLAPEGKPIAFCLDPDTGFEWVGEYDITADRWPAKI